MLVRRQLGHLKAAFRSLEEEVRPLSENRFKWMSEAYMHEIRKLRRQIDNYCAKKKPAKAARGETAGPPAVKRRSV